MGGVESLGGNMKAILEFNLPEDREDYITAVHAMDWALVVWDIEQQMCDWVSHGHNFKDADEVIDKMVEFVRDTMSDRNVNTDMIG